MAMPRLLLRLLNLYPPFFGAGIRVRRLEHGYETRMTLRFYNRNYWGTHFGGSLFAMCDPFFVLTLAERMGKGYAIWDKTTTIQFLRPGRGTVRARMEILPERVAEIRSAADRDGRANPEFVVEVLDESGEVIARLEKVVSVKVTQPASPLSS
jgi:acyl-coenzyme A thioesterase PaaI-like protein